MRVCNIDDSSSHHDARTWAECEVLQEGNEASVFDDEELGVQVVELLGKRCCVAFPCSSILRYLCLHVKVTHYI